MTSRMELPAAALIAAALLAGCEREAPEQRDGAGAADEAETRAVTDMLGRSVAIPERIERIATVNVDAFRMALHLGAEEQLVGMPSDMYGSRFAQAKPVEVRAFDRLDAVPRIGGGQPGSEFSAERALATDPDVFVYWAFSRGEDRPAMRERADRVQERLGVPVVAVNTIGTERESREAVRETIATAYGLMGTLTGREERAEALLGYYDDVVAELRERVAGEAPPRVYLAHRRNLYNHVSYYLPVEQLEAELLTEGRRGQDGEVSAEELLTWDPEYIFLHTPSRASRVGIDEVLEDERISRIEAVSEQRVHRFKGTFMGWDLATGLIDLVHMADVLYPKAMEDVDVDDRGREILDRFYGDPELYEGLLELSSLREEA